MGIFTNRYKFNPETLYYEKINLTTKEKLLQILLLFMGFSLIIGVCVFFVFMQFFDTAGYENMRREKKLLSMQYSKLNKRLEEINNKLQELQIRDEGIYRVIFEAKPLPTSIREAGFGGTDKYADLRGFDNSDLIIETSKKLDQISNKLNIQTKSYSEIIELAKTKAQELQCIPALQPISPSEAHITSYFGSRFHPILRTTRMHEGIDYSGPIGTKIFSPGDGIVQDSEYSGGYGRMLRINHGFGYVTVYAHLDKILVKKGQKIKRGDVIALLGNSGLATGPHLHYEVLKNGVNVNPIYYYFNDLTPVEYYSLINELNDKKSN